MLSGGLLCTAALATVGWSPNYAVTKISAPVVAADDVTREAYPLDEAVIVTHGVTIRFVSERPADGYVRTTHEVAKVLTPGGRDVGEHSVYLDHRSKLTEVSSRTMFGGNVVAHLAPKAVGFRSTSQLSGVLYSEARQARFRTPAVGVGHVVETRTVERVADANMSAQVFDRVHPVRAAWVRVEAPETWKIGASYSEEGAVVPLERETEPLTKKGWVAHTWRIKEIAAFRQEPLGLPLASRARRLRVAVLDAPAGALGSWDAVGAWYRGLVGQRQQLRSEELRSLRSHEAAARTTGTEARVAMFRFVRDRIRYVAIHEGIGAYQPHDASDVLAQRWGDCKDMTTLLVALYESAGVTAYPALIGTTKTGVFDEKLPSVSSFNHAIVAIPRRGGGYDFADATDKSGRFGHLDWSVQGRHALIVKPDGVDLVRTPMSTPDDSQRELTWRVERDGTVRLDMVLRGTSATAIDASIERDRLALERLAHFEARRIRGARLMEVSLEVDEAAPSVRMSAAFTVEAGPAALPLSWFVDSSEEYRVAADRRSPVDLGMPFYERIVVDAEAGPTAPIWTPKEVSLDEAAFSFAVEKTVENGRIRIQRTFRVKKSTIAAGQFAQVRKLGEAMKETALDAIVFATTGGAR